MIEVRSKGQTELSQVEKLTAARSALGQGGKNIVVPWDPEVSIRGSAMELMGSLGVIEMIFHAYVDYRIDQKQHPNETPKEREERKQWEAACSAEQCI